MDLKRNKESLMRFPFRESSKTKWNGMKQRHSVHNVTIIVKLRRSALRRSDQKLQACEGEVLAIQQIRSVCTDNVSQLQ